MPLIESAAAILMLWAVIGYLLGSIPFGLVLTRAMGLGNLREIGSGNIGTTNVLRSGSKAAAAATLILAGGTGAERPVGGATGWMYDVPPLGSHVRVGVRAFKRLAAC